MHWYLKIFFACNFSCQALQNLGLATVIILTGIIVDKYGYLMLEMFFLGCLFGKYICMFRHFSFSNDDCIIAFLTMILIVVSLIAAVLIYIIDSANNGVLNLPSTARDSVKA